MPETNKNDELPVVGAVALTSGIIATDGQTIVHYIQPGQAIKLTIAEVERMGIEVGVEDDRIRWLKRGPV